MHNNRLARLLPYADWTVILCLIVLFFFSFRLDSRINGYVIPAHIPHSESVLEVFHQDTYHIIKWLVRDVHSPNQQDHLLFHVLTDGIYKGIKPILYHGAPSVYLYLKVLTIFEAVLFLLIMRAFLLHFGLSPLRRLALLLLTGCSVSVWFHFSAFETHAMAMPALAGYLLLMHRILRDRHSSPSCYILLGICLIIMALVRLDNFRFILLTILILPFHGAREKWKPLILTITLSMLVSIALYFPLTMHYFNVPTRDVTNTILNRFDREDLLMKMKTFRNFTPEKLGGMTAAMTIYSFVMPCGADTFSTPFADQFKRPGPAVAFGLFLLGLIAALYRLLLRRIWLNPFFLLLAGTGIASLLFYTWFNPLEPFLWIVEIVPLIVAVFALSLTPPADPDASKNGWREHLITGFLFLTVLILIVHNVLHFLLPYRLPLI